MSEVIRIPESGDTVGGQFQLEREIGRGGFGIVYRARQLGIERHVAVKMLMPHALTHEGVVERFKREARLASSLTHPNSVTIYAYGIHSENETDRGLPYIAMEYLQGQTLHEYLYDRGQLSLDETVSVLKQALGSLAEAHRRGIIHRDLKPENIFIVQDDEQEPHERTIKVLDFGIAKAIDGDWDPETRERLTRTGLITGTAEYMAPEQATGQRDITPALDVYAIGCIAFQLLTGDLPFTGNSPMEIAIKHIAEPIPPLPPEYEDLFIGHVVRKALSKEPSHRFQDATDLMETLERGRLDTGDIAATAARATLQHPLGAAIAAQNKQRQAAEASTPAPAPIAQAVTQDAAAVTFDDLEPPPPTRSPVMWVGVAAAFLALAIVGLLVALSFEEPDAPPTDAPETTAAVATTPPANDEPPEAVAAQTPGDDDDGASTRGAPDEAPAQAEADDDSPDLPEAVIIQASPKAVVWRGSDRLGMTPLTLTRDQQGSAPFSIELRADKHQDELLVVNWSELEGDTLDVTLLKDTPRRNVKRNTKTTRAATANKDATAKAPTPSQSAPPNKGDAAPKNTKKNTKKNDKIDIPLWQ